MSGSSHEATGGPEKKPQPAHEKRSSDPLLKIVRAKDPKAQTQGQEMDLELGEFESDRRYGREDIADK